MLSLQSKEMRNFILGIALNTGMNLGVGLSILEREESIMELSMAGLGKVLLLSSTDGIV